MSWFYENGFDPGLDEWTQGRREVTGQLGYLWQCYLGHWPIQLYIHPERLLHGSLLCSSFSGFPAASSCPTPGFGLNPWVWTPGPWKYRKVVSRGQRFNLQGTLGRCLMLALAGRVAVVGKQCGTRWWMLKGMVRLRSREKQAEDGPGFVAFADLKLPRWHHNDRWEQMGTSRL